MEITTKSPITTYLMPDMRRGMADRHHLGTTTIQG